MPKIFLTPQFEIDLLNSQNHDCIVGIDEVGRGSWAGPVAVGAYVFKLDCTKYDYINDSKLLTLKQREEVYKKLCIDEYYIKFGNVEEINQKGVGKTIESAITNLIDTLNNQFVNPYFIIDGQFSKDFGSKTRKIIRADSTFYSVAAASILAKVERDRLMKSLHSTYPEYGFITNVGYPSGFHINALNTHGPSLIHRTSFEPIRNLQLFHSK